MIRLTEMCLLATLLLLSGCEAREGGLAPVVDLKWKHGVKQQPYRHVVVRGETLYAVAFSYDQDFKQLADTNHLYPPYRLRVGQILRIKPEKKSVQHTTRRERSTPSIHYVIPPIPSKPHGAPAPIQASSSPAPKFVFKPMPIPSPAIVGKSTTFSNSQWIWPAHGHIATRFLPDQGYKGINIAGQRGEKIHAAAGGVVAYAGSGIAGYGNLIIIKHDNQYLTAYGNNARNLVTEGQRIKKGQMIAEMGMVERSYWGVHFEIRKSGMPVNPLNYLPRTG